MPTSLPYQPRAFIRTLTNFLFLIVLVIMLLFVAKALRLKPLATNEDAQYKANERNAGKDAKRKRLALGFDLGSSREKTSRDEGTGCSSGGGEGLSEAVEGAEDVVVGC